MFPNAKKEIFGPYSHAGDNTGESKEKDIIFILNDGNQAGIACLSWGKKYIEKYPWEVDHMQIFLDTKEYAFWLINKAYN